MSRAAAHAVRLEDAPVDEHVHAGAVARQHAHLAPLAGALQRVADQHRDVARLGLAHVREDAVLFLLLLVLRHVRVEQPHADVEQLVLGDLGGGPLRRDALHRPLLVARRSPPSSSAASSTPAARGSGCSSIECRITACSSCTGGILPRAARAARGPFPSSRPRATGARRCRRRGRPGCRPAPCSARSRPGRRRQRRHRRPACRRCLADSPRPPGVTAAVARPFAACAVLVPAPSPPVPSPVPASPPRRPRAAAPRRARAAAARARSCETVPAPCACARRTPRRSRRSGDRSRRGARRRSSGRARAARSPALRMPLALPAARTPAASRPAGAAGMPGCARLPDRANPPTAAPARTLRAGRVPPVEPAGPADPGPAAAWPRRPPACAPTAPPRARRLSGRARWPARSGPAAGAWPALRPGWPDCPAGPIPQTRDTLRPPVGSPADPPDAGG